jgi:hypothetical protein
MQKRVVYPKTSEKRKAALININILRAVYLRLRFACRPSCFESSA